MHIARDGERAPAGTRLIKIHLSLKSRPISGFCNGGALPSTMALVEDDDQEFSFSSSPFPQASIHPSHRALLPVVLPFRSGKRR